MVADLNKTLLSLLIALHDLDTPLTKEEELFLQNVAAQLYQKRNAWESDIKPDLLTMIQANENLNELYQTAQSQLKEVDTETLLTYLPTENKILEVTSINRPVPRGFLPKGDSSDGDSLEITNVAINIFAEPKPGETIKKLDGFEKLKEILTTPIS